MLWETCGFKYLVINVTEIWDEGWWQKKIKAYNEFTKFHVAYCVSVTIQ